MSKIPGMQCVELIPGANCYVVPELLQPEPPEGFVDNTVYRYKLDEDGNKVLIGTMDAFPEGWDDPARRRLIPGLGARNQKEDEEMARPRRETPPMETLRALYEKYDAKIQPIAIELDATWMMARRWLIEAGIIEQKQTPTPEPAAAANQEPEREEEESAGTSVAQEAPEITVKDVLLDELAQKLNQRSKENWMKICHGDNGIMIKDSGDRHEFATGAVRDMQAGKGRCDLLPPMAILRLAKHFENGAVKYGERNWEKGIPINSFIDSAIRHIMKYMAGHDDEDHLVAAAWNLMCAMELEETLGYEFERFAPADDEPIDYYPVDEQRREGE